MFIFFIKQLWSWASCFYGMLLALIQWLASDQER